MPWTSKLSERVAAESPEAEGMLASRLSRQSLANMRPDVVNLVNYSSHAFPNAKLSMPPRHAYVVLVCATIILSDILHRYTSSAEVQKWGNLVASEKCSKIIFAKLSFDTAEKEPSKI